MKKVLIFMLLMAVIYPVSAQIVSSQSERVIVTTEEKPVVIKEKKKMPMKFMVKAGAGVDFKVDPNFGFDASFGIAKPLGKGWLWMPEVGCMSWGWAGTPIPIIQCSPVNFGWKLPVNDNVFFLPIAGIYMGYAFSWKDDNYKFKTAAFDIGANIGLGFLIKEKFMVGIHSRLGFIPREEKRHHNDVTCQKLMCSFGILF